MCDFETTVYDGQTSTEVWASACVELYTDDVKIFHSIEEQFEYFKALKHNLIAYYHNLKFDGQFWIDYLLRSTDLTQAYIQEDETKAHVEFIATKEMPNNSFKYIISDMGQWYSIIIKVNNHIIEIRDSYKLLPFTVKKIGESFGTKHKKLDMDYVGYRYAGCEITDEEKEYISNDVLVVKEALEIMFDDGHDKLTIGSCCLTEFKKHFNTKDYEKMFPDLSKIPLDVEQYGSPDVDSYIRKSYKGGWCYVVKAKANQIKHNGLTADVNSLYPSMMHSQSGNAYPIYLPTFWKGNYIPHEALILDRYFFIRIRTRFYLKKDYLPFIQIKGNYLYRGTECLESSDVYDRKTDSYATNYYDELKQLHDTRVTLTLTMTDYYLIQEHYDLVDFEILDGCWFGTQVGIFDCYIDRYKQIKMTSKGAKRESAKLFLNNLYGKFASSTDSSFKYVKFIDGEVKYFSCEAHDKKIGYIPIGSAITSYARNFTIRHAQANYYGSDKPGFIYADTDSIHCDISIEDIKMVEIDDNDFCHWKIESFWDTAIFTRQKTYIEHITHENQKPIDKPYYDVKCAGMPKRCKELFVRSMNIDELTEEEIKANKYTEEEQEFLSTTRTLEDFTIGLTVPSKLLPKRIKGGVLLVPTTYEMR